MRTVALEHLRISFRESRHHHFALPFYILHIPLGYATVLPDISFILCHLQ
jgi:hypothetical protein